MKYSFEDLRELGCPDELLLQYYLMPEEVDRILLARMEQIILGEIE